MLKFIWAKQKALVQGKNEALFKFLKIINLNHSFIMI